MMYVMISHYSLYDALIGGGLNVYRQCPLFFLLNEGEQRFVE